MKLENGIIEGDESTLQLILSNPVKAGRGIALTKCGDIITSHGMKRMPVVRARKKDGVQVGQVYVMGALQKGVVTHARLASGDAVSFILADITPGELPMMPGRPKNREWIDAGYYLGIPPAVFAWQIGIESPNTARLVQKAVVNPIPSNMAAVSGLVRFPDTPCEPWVHPPIQQVRLIHHPITKAAVKKHLGLCVAYDSFDKWRKVLGWKGTEGAAAVWQFRASMGGPEHQILLTHFGELIREVIEPGSERWETWEV